PPSASWRTEAWPGPDEAPVTRATGRAADAVMPVSWVVRLRSRADTGRGGRSMRIWWQGLRRPRRTRSRGSAEIGGQALGLLGGLHHQLAHRRVGVDDVAQLVDGEPAADRDSDLVDDLDGVDAHHGRAQDLAGGGVGDELHETVGLVLPDRLAVAEEAGLAHLHLVTGGRGSLLAQTDHDDLGMGVDAGGDHGPVHRSHPDAEGVL